MHVTIREETAADIPAIEAVTVAAFRNAPHAGHNEHVIVNALREAGQLAISLVAQADGMTIGHVAVSPVSISDGSSSWYGLGPISVLPADQRGGIGSRLMREALRLLREQGAAGCVLLGDPNFYARFGFKVDPNLRFPAAPPEYFQAISFDGACPRGIVSYHQAFGTSAPDAETR